MNKEETTNVSPHISNTSVGCSQPLGFTFWNPYFVKTDSIYNIIGAGKICCIVNPDEFDNRFGKWLEYGLETEDEYLSDKDFAKMNNLIKKC